MALPTRSRSLWQVLSSVVLALTYSLCVLLALAASSSLSLAAAGPVDPDIVAAVSKSPLRSFPFTDIEGSAVLLKTFRFPPGGGSMEFNVSNVAMDMYTPDIEEQYRFRLAILIKSALIT